ncbi:formate dehydrogenase subunit delta [Amaricoccus solimangrovi]|uniref:Formate dehydrogenase subunit delta n=1 Tax=Amaricoccus solimangrovi TaxID=2589815 RepID=A0A501WN81_9RHOB|nr:formate dehydrogenase subunit delta [Amaricoccus solimangrovi]TPE50778.1 formate dehydrogenase subunit delta [Amaricoccus solimangrovi]
MSDSTAEIIRMANQIADFFRPYPAAEAEEGVELHIRDFWDPRMRRELAHVLEQDGEGLSDLARAGAIRVFRTPEPGTVPAPGCDAG